MAAGRNWLLAAACLSFLASLLHLATIVGGGDWYRFLGAGEELAQLDEAGSWRPTIMTLVIAAIIAGWGIYALSAAGIVRKLPLLRTALIAIVAVLLLRATFIFFPVTWGPDNGFVFMAVTSGIVAVMGIVFAIGTAQAWPSLRNASK